MGAAPGISASPSEENMRYFNVIILGPEQSPYEGNTFSQLQLYNHSIPIIICCHLVQTMLMLSIAYIWNKWNIKYYYSIFFLIFMSCYSNEGYSFIDLYKFDLVNFFLLCFISIKFRLWYVQVEYLSWNCFYLKITRWLLQRYLLSIKKACDCLWLLEGFTILPFHILISLVIWSFIISQV